jgi:hypothetical protein
MGASPVSTTFRDMVYAISPSWLRGPIGSRFMYSMAVQLDAAADGIAYAVLARFPTKAPADAMPWIANDRQIEQGFQESQADWTARLTQWLDRWAHAGSPWGVLMAVRGWVAPDPCAVLTVNNRGVFDSYAQGAPCDPAHPPTHTPTFNGWVWDALSGLRLWGFTPWRMWVVLYPGASTWTQTSQVWGDGSRWGNGAVYGVTGGSATASQLQGLRATVKKWKRSRTWVPWIILSWDPAAFLPGASVTPAAEYGTWSMVVSTGVVGRTRYVRSRYAGAAYVEGVV